MKIGIPRALLYYKYKTLWECFFKYLGVEIIKSPNTNKKILKKGVKSSIDESCLSAKIFMGHVEYLIGKCDYILIPRMASVEKNEELCTKFFALPDIIINSFPKAKIITYNVDVRNGKKEKIAYIDLGLSLGFDKKIVKRAYEYAKAQEQLTNMRRVEYQLEDLKATNLKVLIVSHPYNLYDEFIGKPIIDYLRKLQVVPIFADVAVKKDALKMSKKLSNRLYWTFNKELLGGIEIYKNNVNGIIIISSFPCGPDSLVNDLIVRKITDKPIINLIVDEQESMTGIQTRLESFIDILEMREKDR